LFAEGPSDYHFLGELLPRVVRTVAHDRQDPAGLRDPKQALEDVLVAVSAGIDAVKLFERFGQEVDLGALRHLSAFRRLESDLAAALERLAVLQELGARG
jgi:hypothetical protein